MMREEQIPLKELFEAARERNGWPPRYGRHPNPKKEEINQLTLEELKQYKAEGKQLKDIAKDHNTTADYLSKCLTRRGIYWREI